MSGVESSPTAIEIQKEIVMGNSHHIITQFQISSSF